MPLALCEGKLASIADLTQMLQAAVYKHSGAIRNTQPWCRHASESSAPCEAHLELREAQHAGRPDRTSVQR